jgi:hypothetical protein
MTPVFKANDAWATSADMHNEIVALIRRWETAVAFVWDDRRARMEEGHDVEDRLISGGDLKCGNVDIVVRVEGRNYGI